MTNGRIENVKWNWIQSSANKFLHSINALVVRLVLVEEDGQNGLEIIESLVTWRRVYLKYGNRNEQSGSRFSKDTITRWAREHFLINDLYLKKKAVHSH